MGFGSCLGLGLLMSVMSMFYWMKPVSFALLYTVRPGAARDPCARSLAGTGHAARRTHDRVARPGARTTGSRGQAHARPGHAQEDTPAHLMTARDVAPPPAPPPPAVQFGNLIALIGTGFLIGFLQQLKNMADEKRRVASAIYITALVGTLLAVFLIPNPTGKMFAAILCIVVQFCALAWYTVRVPANAVLRARGER
jgi:hypothetical protein